jgi:Trk K+ transport system NAD-binding subunit
MTRLQNRILLLLGAVPVMIVLAAIIYMSGMTYLEDSPRSFWDSIGFAGETLSTTGYGADAQWRHPLMVAYAVLLQFIGVFFVFLIIPVFLVPFLEDRFEERLPRAAPAKLKDHVVIFRYGAAVETLVDNLAKADIATLIVETDEGVARRLADDQRLVAFVRVEENALEAAAITRARALVTNGTDEENAAMILRARQMDFGGGIYSLVEDPVHRKPMELAGATAVYTPRHILAAALAARASDRISPRIAGIQHLGDRLELRELRIHAGSPLVGTTLSESAIGARSGATVIGQWVNGKLLTQPGPDMRLVSRGILVVVGTPENLDSLERLATGATSLRKSGHYVVAGFGEVGRKVHELLTDAGEQVRVIDRLQHTGVDLVGNVLDPSVLRDAGVEAAKSVILALDSDDATLFATVIVQDCTAEAPVIARVNHARNVENIYRAGADFALSISKVSGQMLSFRLLGQEALSLYENLKVQKMTGRKLVDRHPAEAAIRERTGCSIVAVEREGELIVNYDDAFRFRADDSVFVCGSESAVDRFGELFAGS